MIHYWLFKIYGWIALAASVVAIGWALHDDRYWLQILTGTGATILGFCYFVQQQKLAETELFHSLFSTFNARYNEMNGSLADILGTEGEITSSEKKKIVDYFNLCAEEYLFYKEGYIHPEAWTSWCRGMLWYLRRRAFRNVWNEEVETESFYGLTLDEIQKGAKHSSHGK